MKKLRGDFEKHVCVDILIFNGLGELSLQKRALDDKSFPGYWDFSAGGHIDPGEKSQEAAERELFEELGIKPALTFITKEIFHYPGWKPGVTREVDADIYKAVYDGVFKINSEEIYTISFFNMDTINQMIADGQKVHPEFVLAWKKGIISQISQR